MEIIKQQNPKLFDVVIGELQDILAAKIPWLNTVYGRAQRLVRLKDKKEIYYPGIYVAKNDYISVLPDASKGNSVFFTLADPQEIDFVQNSKGVVHSTFSIVFWFNQAEVDGDDSRNTEAIKSQILEVLNTAHLTTGRFEVAKIYERMENIYKDYTLREIDTQYIMQPYSGLRFEGVITIRRSC